MEKFNASNASFESRVKIVDHILANMRVRQKGNSTTGILMTGDPGVGKTSFARFFAKLVGTALITIEAPHITEEHIINIPFIVFNPATGTDKKGDQHLNINDYELVLADSHLYGEMTRARHVPDQEYLQNIYKGGKDLIAVFEHLGGSQDTIPPLVAQVRKQYSVILFLDEFFRQTSPRIRNMLRGILNNKIGSHDLPDNVYTLYASNLATSGTATGIEGIPLNTDFSNLHFGAPEKDDWFAWLVSKFEKDERVKLKPEIIDKFHALLDKEDLSHDDVNAEVRVSPRRWEQVLLYLNSSLPVKDEKEANALMTNIRASFKNYLTGEHSSLANKVMDAVSELIKETSDVSVSSQSGTAKSEWRDTLDHQIAQKMKLGDHRSYVPIISGQPGVGKTTHMSKIAVARDLRYIYVDCSEIEAEDSTGIPLSKNKPDGGIEVKFSFPKLYNTIMEKIKTQDAKYVAKLRAAGKEEEADDYPQREWKYLIFFDEMNRTSIKVFNALRRVILEKNFGDGHKLPKSAIVVAAINPTDVGTTELTGHMRDVVDVIDAAPSWKATKAFLGKMKHEELSNPEMAAKVTGLIEKLADHFKSHETDHPSDEQNFYLEVGSEVVYISPREYVAMVTNTIEHIDVKLQRLLPKLAKVKSDEERSELTEKINDTVKESAFESIKGVLDNITTKHGTASPEFMGMLETWLHKQEDLDILTKSVETLSFDKIMDHYYADSNSDLSNEIEFINYIEAIDSHKYSEDVRNFITKHVIDEASIKLHVVDDSHPKKTIGPDGGVTIEKEMISKVEHFVRELVHAIRVHNLSNEFVEATKLAVLESVKSIHKSLSSKEYLNHLLKFNGNITKFIKAL